MTKVSIFLFLFTVLAKSDANSQTYSSQFEKCSQLFNISDKTADSLYADLLVKRDSCLTGSIAPNFKAKAIDGSLIELAKLKGQVVVLNFWSTGCVPCIEEMPELNKLTKHYTGKKVTFISFAAEKNGLITKFLLKHPFLFKTIANSENIRADIFKLESILPYTIIVDKEGKVYKMTFGGFSNTKETVPFYRNIIDKIL